MKRRAALIGVLAGMLANPYPWLFRVAIVTTTILLTARQASAAITISQQTATDTGNCAGGVCQVSFSAGAASGHTITILGTYQNTSSDTISSICDSTTSAACSSSLNTYTILSNVCNGGGLGSVCAQIAYACNVTGSPKFINMTMAIATPNTSSFTIVDLGGMASSCFDISKIGTATTSPISTANYSTAQASEIALAIVGDDQTCQTWTVGLGFTLLNAPTCTTTSSQGEYQIYSSVQSGVNASMSFNTNGDSMAMMVALFKGSGGASTPANQFPRVYR